MSKDIFLIIALILIIGFDSNAQQIPNPYKFSDEILKSNNDPQMTSWELCNIGEYKKAIEEWDKNEEVHKALTDKQLNDFFKYKPKNAVDLISDRAKTEQIIIINEAHHQPCHRVFTTLLLKNLYEEGYRYLCIETLAYLDTQLSNRRYPIINSGGYSREPFYGNLLREALKLGFRLVAYEDTTNSDFDTLGNNLREVEQTKNIAKIFSFDPKAKVLIHCGFGHIKEGSLKSWGKAMAGRLKEYTNINPFTIDQVSLTEHSDTSKEDPYFKLVKLNYYAMFVDSNGKLFNGAEQNIQYDTRVYHPRSNYIEGRPHWVFENNRVPYILSKLKATYPILVKAYFASEENNSFNPYENAVPFDIIEIKNQNERKALSLIKGNFTIRIIDVLKSEQIINVVVE